MLDSVKTEETSVYESDDDDAPELTYKLTAPLRAQKLQGASHKKPIRLYCGLCRATFGRPDHLKRHIECLHSTFIFCKCPVCDKKFASEATTKKHVKATHSELDTYKCRVCQTAFNCFSKLSSHETTHLAARHKCECGAQFKRRDHMLRHVRSMHLNQNFACMHCGQTLKRRDHLTKHLREKHSKVKLEGTSDCSL